MSKPIFIFAALCALLVMPASPSSAQSPAAATDASPNISLGGRVVMRIRTGAGGYSAEQRADAVRHRLIPILSMRNLGPNDITVAMVNPGQSNIMVRGHLLFTVDQTLAKANAETPVQLADAWAANLRQTLPQASVAPGAQYSQGQM